jgi:hypothetical protein
MRNEPNSIGVAPVVGDGFAANFDGRIGVCQEGSGLEQASGAGGEAAGETDGVVAVLRQPVWGDIAFGAVEEADDGGGLAGGGAWVTTDGGVSF